MAEQQPAAYQAQFQIHKLFVVDMSLEIPNGSQTFQEEWQPELNVELDHKSKPLAEKETHQVILKVKCTVKNGGKEAFMVEVHQAGIFGIQGLEGDQLKHTLGAFCPNILYHYLREAISDIVMKAGFPQLSLAPINFDMLYEQQQNGEQDETKVIH